MNEKQLVAGYGSFITSGTWKDKLNPQICQVQGFRRVFNEQYAWYPFAIPDAKSTFLAIVFEVSGNQLSSLDRYECAPSLYYRMQTKVLVRDGGDWVQKTAWIYVPPEKTLKEKRATKAFKQPTPDKPLGFPFYDYEDLWLKQKVRKANMKTKFGKELAEKFPEFFDEDFELKKLSLWQRLLQRFQKPLIRRTYEELRQDLRVEYKFPVCPECLVKSHQREENWLRCPVCGRWWNAEDGEFDQD